MTAHTPTDRTLKLTLKQALIVSLSVLGCLWLLTVVAPAQAQETAYPPFGEYVLFWQPANHDAVGCQTLPGADPPAAPACGEASPPAAGDCAACRGATEATVPDRLACGSITAEPPEHLWADLLELQARGQVKIRERLPDQRGLRLRADAAAAAQLNDHPETARLLLLEPVAAPPGERQDQAPPTPAPTENAPQPVSPPVEAEPRAEQPSESARTEPTPLPETAPAWPLSEIITYTWVNNQGANPPIAYNWVEISPTGTIVAQGDDTSTQVELGFPFTFYGTDYTRAFVSSNGFVSFGSGSTSYNNTGIPSANSPNNAIYAFWDDLKPAGDADGNVYVRQVDATTYVVEWHRVKRLAGSSDYETFQIILNGANNTILLQYQTVSGVGSSTVGVENGDGTFATQYAYDSSSAIFNGLAIKFTPATLPVYSIQGTVRDYDNVPVAAAQVVVIAGPLRPQAATDANGAYTLTVISGAYTLQATKEGYFTTPTRTVTLPPDQVGVDLTFPERYTISGIVRDYDGTPLAGVRVATSGGPVSASTYTPASGVYTLTVIAGSYTVAADLYNNAMNPPGRTVTVPPSQSGVDFTFPTRYTISGTARDSDGAPLSNVAIHYSGPIAGATWVNAQGVYTITVAAGTYNLSVYASSFPQPTCAIRDRAAQPQRRELHFPGV
ncbi:MAG: carboxypeptidase regulatory-like domain-containing protein [Chloroflexi bacterium]|nr:carboxypeptidase regulatory-like domain-containing protein [Chloroflexota bacterium]